MRYMLLVLMLALGACATVKDPDARHEKEQGAREFYQLALKNWRQGQLRQAMQAAEHAIKIDPTHARAHELQALVNQRLGQNERATASFKRALVLTPDDAAILNNYATFLCANKDYEAAQARFLTAATLSSNPSPDIAYTNAGLCARRAGQTEQARTFFKQAIHANPGQSAAIYQLASLNLATADPVAASALLEQYLQHAVHTAKTLLLGARIEHALQNPAGLEDYVTKLRAGFPESGARTQAEKLLAAGNFQTRASRPATRDTTWIKGRTPANYTIHIATRDTETDINPLAALAPATETTAVWSTRRAGIESFHLISGNYPTLAAARSALSAFSPELRSLRPWVRTFKGIQAGLKAASTQQPKASSLSFPLSPLSTGRQGNSQ